MERYILLLTDLMGPSLAWLTEAWRNLQELIFVVGQYATLNVVALIAIFASGTLTVVSILRWGRRRVLGAARERLAKRRFASVISGFAQFQSTYFSDRKSSHVTGNTNANAHSQLELARSETRVENKVMNVHPREEQSVIDLMSHFRWRLQSSDPVFNQDTHEEVRGDKLYSVTETVNYVHLVFARDLDEPNLDRIRALEREYFSIVFPNVPGYVMPILLGIFLGAVTYGVAAVLAILWAVNISGRRKQAQEEIGRLRARQVEILTECDGL